MAKGSAFGKTILIGDQFVLEEVPAIVSSIPFETVAEVARQVGGSIDACHDDTTATIVDIGQEEALVMAMDKLIRAELSEK